MDLPTLRPATEADVPFLLELRRQTMSAHQLASGLVPSEEERERRVLYSFENARIVLSGGEPVGLLKVRRDGLTWELVQIQLSPSLHGKGVGTALLRALVAEARAAGASLRLSVHRANPARRLYERLGFVVVEERANFYDMELGA